MADRILLRCEECSPSERLHARYPGQLVIDRYGLFNQDDPRGREITHPRNVGDRQGGRRLVAFVEVDYNVRPTNDDILTALAALQPGSDPVTSL